MRVIHVIVLSIILVFVFGCSETKIEKQEVGMNGNNSESEVIINKTLNDNTALNTTPNEKIENTVAQQNDFENDTSNLNLLNQLMFQNRLSSCKEAGGEERNKCFVELVKEYGNVTICNKYVTMEDYESLCYYIIANHTLNDEYCSKAKKHVNKCYSELSIKLDDYDICKKNEKYEECYLYFALIKQDFKLCDDCPNSFSKSNCFLSYLQEYEEEEICDYVSGDITGEICIALLNSDLEKCEWIFERKYRPEGWDEERDVDGDIFWSDQCYFRIAMKERNKSICNNIRSKEDWMFGKENCLKEVNLINK